MKKFSFIFLMLILVSLTACSKSYTVTFETNGAGEVEAKTLSKGDILEIPTLTREGYSFSGWFKDKELSDPFSTKNPTVDSNMTLYASWTILKYNVVFRDYDNRLIETASDVPYGSAASAPASPNREGYAFTGWSEAFDNVKANIITFAQYKPITYEVRFLDKDGNLIGAPLEVAHGQTATPPAAPTVEGYTFTSWDKDLTNVLKNMDTQALYSKNVYSVEFQDDKGIRIGSIQQVDYLDDASAPTAPTKEGYKFVAWDKDFTSVKENIVVKAKYDAIEYDIEYYDGATKLNHGPSKYTIDSTVSFSEYEKANNIFVAWYSDAELTKEISGFDRGEIGLKKVYGKWLDSSKKYNLEYELNGGSWTWSSATVTNAATNGVSPNTNLAEQFMADFYMYLKDNNLLESSLVHSGLHKTNWTTFSANYKDPVASFNWSEDAPDGGGYSRNQGYNQFFYDKATGNDTTGEILSITGGFLGTEPYKSKYANLAHHLAVMLPLKYDSLKFWNNSLSDKGGLAFMFDGYLYGTQGLLGNTIFDAYRALIPNTNVKYVVDGSKVVQVETAYQITEYIQGLEGKLVAPIKDGHYFAGWYDNAELSGKPILSVTAGVAPASKYYAKWIPYTDFE